MKIWAITYKINDDEVLYGTYQNKELALEKYEFVVKRHEDETTQIFEIDLDGVSSNITPHSMEKK